MAPKKKTKRLKDVIVNEVSFVDRGANCRRWLVLKRDGAPAAPPASRQRTEKQTMPEDLPAARARELTPRAGMSDEDLTEQRAARSRLAGIEVLNGAPLRFPANRPTRLRDYSDWVNFRLPMDTAGRARNALARFRQTSGEYTRRRSAEIVYRRAVKAALDHGVAVAYDPADRFDRSLPRQLKERLRAAAASREASDKGLADTFRAAADRARRGVLRIAAEGARRARQRAEKAVVRPLSRRDDNRARNGRRVQAPSALPAEARPASSRSRQANHWPADLNELVDKEDSAA